MRFAELMSAATIAVGITTVLAEDAPVIKGNPVGGVAFAIIKTDNGALDSVVAVSTAEGGEGVRIVMNINGNEPHLSGGPFMYHIHEKAIAANGSCASAGAHLDPTKRGESPGCDATKPETCQVGDLSGKWGNCETVPGCSKTFTDKYLSLTAGNPAYLGDKSFVIHYANKTRIACANFVYGPQGGPSATVSSPSAVSSSASAASVSASAVSSSIAAGAIPTGGSTSGAALIPGTAAPAASATASGAATSVGAMSSLTGFTLAFLGLTLW